MRKLILKLEYTTPGSVEEFIRDNYIEVFKNYSYEKKSQKNVMIELNNNINELEETFSLPIKELQNQIIHSFFKIDEFNNKITILIGNYYLAINVECFNYPGLNSYLELFSLLASKLETSLKILDRKKFGLRKIGYDFFEDKEEIVENFEPHLFFSPFEVFDLQASKSEQIIIPKEQNYKINVIRSLEVGDLTNEKGDKKEVRKIGLDFDGIYYLTSKDSYDRESITSRILTLNDGLFEVFKNTVTLNFLEKHLKKGDK